MKKILIAFITIFLMTFCILEAKALSTYEEWGKYQNLSKYTQVDTEMRAVWVSTVWNMDMPKLKGTSEENIKEWKNHYLSILDTAQYYNLNTIIFQIRPANDAFYPSKYNPWSSYLYSYGKDPGWDPLEWMIEVTHERGLEYHAWMNPYRASVSMSFTMKNDGGKIIDYNDTELQKLKTEYFSNLKNSCGKAYDGTDVDNPVFATGDELKHNVVLGTEEMFVLNPASQTTITHLENTIREVVENYDIDGIHFDDYFYPNDTSYAGTNPNYKGKTYSCEPGVDYADYQAYLSNGGSLNVYDWRRENINTLIHNLNTMIEAINSKKERPCVFGISPSGRWAPSVESCPASPERGTEGGMTGSCGNYYSYSDLYADTKKWVDEEWIDYILPQVYSKLIGGYTEVVEWWSNAMKDSPVKLYVGTGLYLHEEWDNSTTTSNTDEVYYQVRYNQSNKNRVDGYAIFDYTSLLSGESKTDMLMIKRTLWKTNALTPIYNGYTYQHTVSELAKETKISETATANTYKLECSEVDDAKAYAIYRLSKENNAAYLNGTYELSATDMVLMNLKGNNVFTVEYDESYVYYLATASKDNTFYVNEEPIDFTKIEVNVAPTVTMTFDWKENILAGTQAKFKFKIEDANGDDVTFSITINNSKVNYTDLGNQEIEIVWNTYYVETKNVTLKIVATDGKSTTTYEMPKFNVVEECTHSYSSATCELPSTCTLCGDTIGTALGHSWSNATCDSPKTCTVCGQTEGSQLEHSWSSATCELPSTCTLCGDTNGTALGHSWSDATCESPATCTVCHKTEGTALGHSWVDANYDAPKTCSVCHKTEGEPLEAKGCAKCNKSSVTLILLFTSALTTIGLFLKKRGIK